MGDSSFLAFATFSSPLPFAGYKNIKTRIKINKIKVQGLEFVKKTFVIYFW